MPERIRFEVPTLGSPLHGDVVALGESQKKLLGVLPYAAWDEAFATGGVLARVEADQLLGYALFRLPRQEVVLVHLCVAPEFRKRDVARTLVDELSRRYGDRTGIRVKCRRDYAANDVWPRLGFTPLGNAPGRSDDAALLTLWWKDHGHPTLFSWSGASPGTLPVLVDANVFIDIHGEDQSPESRNSRALIERILHRIQVLVAPETRTEVNRSTEAEQRRRLLDRTHDYPQLAVTESEIDERVELLVHEAGMRPTGRRQVSDLRQVATALAADIPVFVSRDRRLRDTWADAAYNVADLLVLSPSEAVALALSENTEQAYVPQALHGTELVHADVAPADTHKLRSFINGGGRETRGVFEALQATIASRAPMSQRIMIRDADQELVLVGYTWDKQELRVECARIMQSALLPTLAVQLTEQVRRKAAEVGVSTIRVLDRHLHSRVTKAFEDDGYRALGDGLIGHTVTALVSSAEMHDLTRRLGAIPTTSAVPDAARSAVLEHTLRPLRILDAQLPTYLVSINEGFADELLGYPPSLLPRPTGVALGLGTGVLPGGQGGRASTWKNPLETDRQEGRGVRMQLTHRRPRRNARSASQAV